MPLKLSELTADVSVAAWLKREVAAKRPTSAAKAFRLLRAFVRWADERPEYQGLIASDACTARSVREALPSSKAKRKRLLAERPIERVVHGGALAAKSDHCRLPASAAAHGVRAARNCSRLKWADVDSQLAPSLAMRTTAVSDRQGRQ